MLKVITKPWSNGIDSKALKISYIPCTPVPLFLAFAWEWVEGHTILPSHQLHRISGNLNFLMDLF